MRNALGRSLRLLHCLIHRERVSRHFLLSVTLLIISGWMIAFFPAASDNSATQSNYPIYKSQALGTLNEELANGSDRLSKISAGDYPSPADYEAAAKQIRESLFRIRAEYQRISDMEEETYYFTYPAGDAVTALIQTMGSPDPVGQADIPGINRTLEAGLASRDPAIYAQAYNIKHKLLADPGENNAQSAYLRVSRVQAVIILPLISALTAVSVFSGRKTGSRQTPQSNPLIKFLAAALLITAALALRWLVISGMAALFLDRRLGGMLLYSSAQLTGSFFPEVFSFSPMTFDQLLRFVQGTDLLYALFIQAVAVLLFQLTDSQLTGITLPAVISLASCLTLPLFNKGTSGLFFPGAYPAWGMLSQLESRRMIYSGFGRDAAPLLIKDFPAVLQSLLLGILIFWLASAAIGRLKMVKHNRPGYE